MATHGLSCTAWPRSPLQRLRDALAEGARVHYWLALCLTIVVAFGWAVLS